MWNSAREILEEEKKEEFYDDIFPSRTFTVYVAGCGSKLESPGSWPERKKRVRKGIAGLAIAAGLSQDTNLEPGDISTFLRPRT